MTTMISDLSRDLIEEILTRLPLKHMRAAVRLTCKKWNVLSESESFKKMQIGKAREHESMMIAMMDHNLYLMTVDNDHLSVELKGKLSYLNEQVKISKVFCCEGLLLCVLDKETRFVVWNPYCGQTTWIEPRYSLVARVLFRYALGYEDKSSCHSFKLLRFIDYSRYVDYPGLQAPGKQFSWYEIYHFDSGLWTTLDVAPRWYISPCDNGDSLKGNTYWRAVENEGDNDHLICFDFTRERFEPFLPLPFKIRCHEYVNLSCVREEKLSVLTQVYHDHESSNPYELQIWVTTKIEVEKVSWSNVFKLKTNNVPHISGSYVIDEEKKLVMAYADDPKRFITIGEAGYLRDLDHEIPILDKCPTRMDIRVGYVYALCMSQA